MRAQQMIASDPLQRSFREQLQRHIAVQHLVPRTIHDTPTAFANLGNDWEADPARVPTRFGDVAVIYSQYVVETEVDGKRSLESGRVTEIFVLRAGKWTNPGWHTDSGQ